MTGIRKETVLKIALLAINKENISRDALARELSLSSMTVGKAVKALVEAGIVCETRDPVSRGRHASLVSPSDFPVFVYVFMSSQKLTLIAETLGQKKIATLSRAANPSLSCKENLNSIIRELIELHELENRVAAFSIVLLSDKDEFNGFDIASEDIYELDTLVKDEVSRRHPNENVLYVNISDDKVHPLALSHANLFYRDGAKDIYTDNAKDTARQTARLAASLSVYSPLSRVIIEGDASEENELLYLVKESLLSKYGMAKKELPRIEYYGKLSFVSQSLYEQVRAAYITSVCNSLFVGE